MDFVVFLILLTICDYAAQADLDLGGPSASASWVLGLLDCPSVTTPYIVFSFWSFCPKGCPKPVATNVQTWLWVWEVLHWITSFKRQTNFNHTWGRFCWLWGSNSSFQFFLDNFWIFGPWILCPCIRIFLFHPSSDYRGVQTLPASCAQQ